MGVLFLRGDNVAVVAEIQTNSPNEVYGNPIPPMQLH
jgi:hypothetical protein